jgi:hypothetical protein
MQLAQGQLACEDAMDGQGNTEVLCVVGLGKVSLLFPSPDGPGNKTTGIRCRRPTLNRTRPPPSPNSQAKSLKCNI